MRDDKFIAQKEHWVSELSKHWSYIGPLNEDPLENLWLLMNGRNMWMGRLDLESCLYEKKIPLWQNTDVYPVSWQKCDYVDCIDSCQSLGHSVFEHGSEVGIFFPGGCRVGGVLMVVTAYFIWTRKTQCLQRSRSRLTPLLAEEGSQNGQFYWQLSEPVGTGLWLLWVSICRKNQKYWFLPTVGALRTGVTNCL